MECPEKKWRYAGETFNEKYLSERWYEHNGMTKASFEMTRKYKSFLKEKRKQEYLVKVNYLRTKLENQKRDFGEVDEIDLSDYIYWLGEYNKYCRQ